MACELINEEEARLVEKTSGEICREIIVKRNNEGDVEISVSKGKLKTKGFWRILASSIEEACEKAIQEHGRKSIAQ